MQDLHGNLSEQERRAVVAGRTYEELRREYGQKGYSLIQLDKDGNVQRTPPLKQMETVVGWLSEKLWKAGLNDVHWQGYFRFCFEKMKPRCPQPGQLKNLRNLREYIKSAPSTEKMDYQQQTNEEMSSLYDKILRGPFSNTSVRRKMGLL